METQNRELHRVVATQLFIGMENIQLFNEARIKKLFLKDGR
jgi:hypothetical protein